MATYGCECRRVKRTLIKMINVQDNILQAGLETLTTRLEPSYEIRYLQVTERSPVYLSSDLRQFEACHIPVKHKHQAFPFNCFVFHWADVVHALKLISLVEIEIKRCLDISF